MWRLRHWLFLATMSIQIFVFAQEEEFLSLDEITFSPEEIANLNNKVEQLKKPEPPLVIIPAKPIEPITITVVAAPTEVGFPLEIPYLGTFTLIPYSDKTKIPVESGLRVKLASPDKKLDLGPLIINDAELHKIGDKFGLTGLATIMDQQARFGLKDIDFNAEKKFIKKVVLGITFISKPSLELIPGAKFEIAEADVILEREKPLELRFETKLFGQSVTIAFILAKELVSGYAELPTTLMSDMIPETKDIPLLGNGHVTKTRLEINNVWNKKKEGAVTPAMTVVLKGQVDLPMDSVVIADSQKPDQPGVNLATDAEKKMRKAFGLDINFAKDGVQGSLVAEQFPLPGVGAINSAKIILDTKNKPAHFTLKGNMSFNVADVGKLDIELESAITKQGIVFTGRLPKEFTYADVTLKQVSVAFDTQRKAVEILGKLFLPMLSNIELSAELGLMPDPTNPQQKMIDFKTKTVSQELKPFSGIPGIEGFSIKNFDAGVDIVRIAGAVTKSFHLNGDFNFLGVSLKSVTKFVKNEKGESGVYINAPLTQDKKLSDIIPAFKGPIFDGLEFRQASFVACSIDYTDIDPVTKQKKEIKKGLSFLAAVPLKGTLEPVGKFIGSTDQTFTMYGNLLPQNLPLSELGFLLSAGYPSDKIVSMGQTSVILTGQPSFGVKTEIFFRPSAQETLKFVGKFEFKPTDVEINSTLQGVWNQPFGLPKSQLSDVVLGIGMTYGSPGLPTKLTGGGNLKIGDFEAKAYFSADAALKDMAIKAEISESMTMSKLIAKILKGAYDINIPSFLLPDPEFKNLKMEMAPKDTMIGPELVRQGLAFSGQFTFLTSNAYVDILFRPPSFDGGGMKIFGAIDTVNLAGGALKIVKSAQEYGGRCFVPGKVEACKVPDTTDLKRAGEDFAAAKGAVLTEKQKQHIDKPRIDIEVTPKRQNFLISGQLQLATVFEADACMSCDTSGLHFMFEAGLRQGGKVIMFDDKPLFLARVIGNSSGAITNPQFELSIDFMQNLQQWLRQNALNAISAAQQQVKEGIDTAKNEIDKINNVTAEAEKKLADARQKVDDAKKALQAIENAKRAVSGPIDSEIAKVNKQLADLESWWNSLPDY